jgi:hypothetical protein
LSAIASIFGLNTSTLMAGNCLTDSLIFAGQTLRVPSQYVPPAEPVPVAPQPETSTGGWGGCGSCNTCGYDSSQCVLSPEGQCLWDPATHGCAASPTASIRRRTTPATHNADVGTDAYAGSDAYALIFCGPLIGLIAPT